MLIRPFIISWQGCHEKTCNTEKALSRAFCVPATVVSGDPARRSHWLPIDEKARFREQTEKIFTLFLESPCDVLLLVTGDVYSHQWTEILYSAMRTFSHYDCGIFAPLIHFSTWSEVYIPSITFPEKNLHPLVCSDGIAVFISRDIIQQYMNDYHIFFKESVIGYGIDLTLCALSWLAGKPVIQDESFTVYHPIASGYDKSLALDEMHTAFSRMSGKVKKYIDCAVSRDYVSLKPLISE
jgi:hypothetical protein